MRIKRFEALGTAFAQRSLEPEPFTLDPERGDDRGAPPEGRIDCALDGLAGALLLFLTVIALAQVFARYLFALSLPWTEELGRFVFTWVTWIGAVMATRGECWKLFGGHERRASLLVGALLVVPLLVLGTAAAVTGQPAAPSDEVFSPEQVMTSLNRTLGWYQQARIVMRSIDDAGALVRAEEPTALRLLGRAFDAARAQAAVLARDKRGSTPASARRAEEQARLQAAIRRQQQEVASLQSRIRAAPAGRRAALERAAVAARNRLELDRARLEFLGQLRDLDSSPSSDDDLEHQIEALHDSVPELRSSGPSAGAAPLAATAAPAADTTSGSWAMVQRLLALQRSRSSLEELTQATHAVAQGVDEHRQIVRAAVKPIGARLRALAEDPEGGGVTSLTDSEREFRDLLERRKLLLAVMLPLREESALARRYATDLHGWRGAIARESRRALQNLAIDLLGVVAALVIVLIAGVLWRIAVGRYVTDIARRRLLLTARSVVITIAIVLVFVFHFTSEIAALVTVLGFAAAGIAFALQNVILAVAGYFTMVAPNGIRVGDRVSLQGPFGYVHGEVTEIGFVRIKLRELSGETLQPTGRDVVFPNSVVFTGSFFKDPPARPSA